MYMDDYRNMVAMFSKTLNMDMACPPASNAASGSQESCWTVLGYFDFLQIYPLPRKERSWLSDVLRHNRAITAQLNGAYYFHPLHLTAGGEGEEALYRRFWTEREDMPFLILTLVQESAPGRVRKIREEIERGETNDVPRVCYHTMELSDLAVVWRSDSLIKLFREIHRLYQLEIVGDMSSFTAIDRTFLEDFAAGRRPVADAGQKLFASARFVVRNAAASHAYLQALRQAGTDISHTYFSTGIEDLHMLLENISVYDFLRFFHAHLHNPYQYAFFECATRLGIPEEVPQELTGRHRPADSPLTQKCKCLLTKFQCACRQTHDDTSWMKPAGNLLNVLADMSKNCVMDGFCYLIYDAARLFCDKIQEWSISQAALDNNAQTSALQRFVRGWDELMEQATRTDGRFIQMPGFSPAVCEIPAHLLECYLSVTMCCAELMMVPPDESDAALLLVPKICRRVKVYPILDTTRGETHLLYVDIPMELLYNPLSVLCALCHELAHNIGNTCRKRKLRSYKILYATAYELANWLGLPPSNSVQTIYTALRYVCEENDNYSTLYLSELTVLLRGGVRALLENSEEFSHWIQQAAGHDPVKTRALQNTGSIKRGGLQYGNNAFHAEMANLLYLFRECYADMIMLYLLRPDWTVYEALAIPELRMRVEVARKRGEEAAFWKSESYCTLVERWGLVIALMLDRRIWNVSGPAQPGDPISERFHADVNAFISWLNSSGSASPHYRSKESLWQVLDYLDSCYQAMDASFQTDARLSELEALHTLVAGLSDEYPINYEKFGHFITMYRKKMLKAEP